MKKNLLILGAGQFGTVVKEIAESLGVFEKIAFLDDTFGREEYEGDYHEQSIGKLDQYEEFRADYNYALVSIEDPEIRMEWTKKLLESDYSIPILVSPHAYVSPNAQLSMGTVVEPMAVVNANTHIGNGSFVAAGAVIDHNLFVADYCNIQCGTIVMPGALVPNFTITQPNEVVRRLPMSFSLGNKDGETSIKGTPIKATSDGNVEG
jgi:UDP-N-acetylbacillosamine N-acetyltransferase